VGAPAVVGAQVCLARVARGLEIVVKARAVDASGRRAVPGSPALRRVGAKAA